jgi:thiamine biosynthesis lipoprotein
MNPTHRIGRRRALALGLAGIGGLAAARAGFRRAAPQLRRRDGVAFGTTVSITLEARNRAMAEAAFAAGFAEIRRIDRIASLTREDGEVFRLNRDGRLDDPSPALIDMLRMAADMHAASEGAFDVTVQPLWLALDAAARSGAWPSDDAISAIARRIDQTALNVSARRVEFAKPGMAVTLNSLARGYAADRVARTLAAEGVVNAFLDIDELESLGARPDGAAWRAIVQHPRDPGANVGAASVTGCLATSGDYRYFWSPDYARNHIIHPRTGASPADFASVSVLARGGLLADALSTAVFLVGAAKAPALLRRYHAEALFVTKEGKISATAGFPIATLA